MYTTTNCTSKDATILVNGQIIPGAIFDGATFVAGFWLGPNFRPERLDPLAASTRLSAPWTLDVAGRDSETIDDGFGLVQRVYRLTRADVAR